ncbi:MAG: hypothetical protein CMJ36_01555 [Phycisphaerae bacterium]|nr:hypothetical protein [Phycisphaerae bacterium]
MTVFITTGIILLEVCLVLGLALHILLRRTGSTEARLTWLLLVILLPYAGAIAYMLLSAPRSYRHTRRHRRVRGSMRAAFVRRWVTSRTWNPTFLVSSNPSSRSRNRFRIPT